MNSALSWMVLSDQCELVSKRWEPGSSGRQVMPHGSGGRAVLLEDFAAVEVAAMVELIVDRGVKDGEFLQRLHVPEPRNLSFLPSEWLMGVVTLIEFPMNCGDSR